MTTLFLSEIYNDENISLFIDKTLFFIYSFRIPK